VAAALGLDAARYQRLRDDLQRSQLESLDGAASAKKEVADETYDLEHIVDTFRRGAMIERAAAGLPQRESRVIALCFGQDRTLREAGSELGLTESRVCQLRASALRRLRTQFARSAVMEGA
jgi:RNA polymerase sigma factor for flagellar operon FliA